MTATTAPAELAVEEVAMGLRITGLVVLACVVWGCRPPGEPLPPSGDSVFYLVRHAEKADQSEDPPLTEDGRARARTLAGMLRDAGVERVYSSDFERTRDTAAPLASDRGLELTLYDPDRLPALANDLLASPGRVLVVGHSNTTPDLAELLGGAPGAPISEDEYDRLYVLTRHPGAGTTTVLLRFGAR